MLNLFKNKDITDIIEKILEEIFIKIDEIKYLEQIKSGCIRKISRSAYGNGFNISYNSQVSDFEDLRGSDIVFSNIKIINEKEQVNKIDIVIIGNIIAGINYDNDKFDFSGKMKFDVSEYRKILPKIDKKTERYLQDFDVDLSSNESTIYLVKIKDREFIYLRDVNNGDFIGFYDKKLYRIIYDDSNSLLTPHELPEGFTYPEDFLRIVNQGLIDFDPWIILQGEQLRDRFYGLEKRYPKRELIPFARREDNDDVACWQKDNPNIIYIIHDFASSGYENKEEFNSFWEWLRQALEDTINYEGDY